MSRTPIVPGYTLVDRMHRGPRADVWRASREGDGRPVAVKIPAPGPDGADIAAESALLRAARHDNLIGVVEEVYLADGRAALVTDLADGGSLADLVAARGHLTPSEACAVLGPVTDALWSLHRQGLVHGDVSPANVLLTDTAQPLLADLGASASGVWGTEGFTAPELLADEPPSAASDVFGVGAVLVHALTGQGVSPLEQPDRVLRRVADAVDLPDGLDQMLRSVLAGDPASRPRAVDLARALQEVASPEALDIGGRREDDLVTYRVRARHPKAPAPAAVPERRRSWGPVFGIGGGAVAAAGLVAVAAPHAGVVTQLVGGSASSVAAPSATRTPVPAPAPAKAHDAAASPVTHASATEAAARPAPVVTDPAANQGAASKDPAAVLGSLMAARAQAFAARDRAALNAVDAPGSWAMTRDTAIVDQLVGRDERQQGLAFAVEDATVVSASSSRTLLDANVVVRPYRSVRAGQARAVAARTLPQQRYTLVWVKGRWLIEQVAPGAARP